MLLNQGLAAVRHCLYNGDAAVQVSLPWGHHGLLERTAGGQPLHAGCPCMQQQGVMARVAALQLQTTG
jgi:hypothetical protein